MTTVSWLLLRLLQPEIFPLAHRCPFRLIQSVSGHDHIIVSDYAV